MSTEDTPKRYQPTGDWRDQREVHRLLSEAQGKPPSANVPDEEWKLVEQVIEAYRKMREAWDKPFCGECKKIIEHGWVIRCLDCSMPLHENYCAVRHFWPKGRPESSYPTAFGKPLMPDPGKR
jgi:hypothetical protein